VLKHPLKVFEYLKSNETLNYLLYTPKTSA